MMLGTSWVFLLLLSGLAHGRLVYPGWDDWKPEMMGSRDDLLCSGYCGGTVTPRPGDNTVNTDDYDNCCVCYSSTTWIEDNSLVDLTIEYMTADGGSVALQQDEKDTRKQIIHKNGVMTSLPANMGNISNLTIIDFSGNKIISLSGIEDAVFLDTVILEGNQIEYLSNASLADLSFLRCLNLANNMIQKIDPGTVSQPNIKPLMIDLSNNTMTSVDITNMVSKQKYCKIDFSNSPIEKLTNDGGFNLDMDQSYGPGFTSFANTNFVTFPNFQQLLQLDSLSQLGKLFSSGFDFRDIPLICDCNVENFLNVSHEIVEGLWREYMDVKCAGPEKYKGVRLVDVPLSEMVCHLGVEDNCPIECSCIDQPYHNTIKIDCVEALLTSLPATLPTSDFSDTLSLNFTGNNITDIPHGLSYIERIETLDMSNNNLNHISEEVGARLENATSLILDNNPDLKTLPQVFQFRNECSIRLAEQIIDCDCNSRWIEQWLHARGCKDTSHGEENITYMYITTPGPNSSLDFDISNETSTGSANSSVTEMFTSSSSTAITTSPVYTTTDSQNTDTTANFTSSYNDEHNGTDSVSSTDTSKIGANLYCRVPGVGLINASDFNSEMLTCRAGVNTWVVIVTYVLVSVLTALISVAIIIFLFRYELLVLFIRFVLQKPKENILTSRITHDAFVSFDEANPDLIRWTEKVLIPCLERDGYKLFIPYRHIQYGDVRDDATIEAMNKSRNMLLLMSESYLEPTEERPHTENQWKYGWNKFKSSRHTPIIVVNFDHITSDMVDDPRIKAYLRVGKVIDFTNQTRDIIPNLELALGKHHDENVESVLKDEPMYAVSCSSFPEMTDTTLPKRFWHTAITKPADDGGIFIDDSNTDEQSSTDEPVSHPDDDIFESDFDNTPRNPSVINVKPVVWTQVMTRRHKPPAKLGIQDADEQRDEIVGTSERGTQNFRANYKPNGHQDTPRAKDNSQKAHWESNRTKEFVFSNHLHQNRNRENTVLLSTMFKRLYRSDEGSFV